MRFALRKRENLNYPSFESYNGSKTRGRGGIEMWRMKISQTLASLAFCISAAGSIALADETPPPKCLRIVSEAFENFVISPLHVSPSGDGAIYAGKSQSDTQPAIADVPEKARRLLLETIESGKGWAAYGTRTNTENKLETQVLYVFEDGDSCATFPKVPKRISTIYLPGGVSRSLLLFFRQPTSGDDAELRTRLQAFLTKTNQDRPVTTAPHAVKGARLQKIDSGQFVSKWSNVFPPAMLASLARWQDACNARSDGSKMDLSDRFIDRMDVDGDGDEDWVANGYGLYCIGPDGNRRQMAGDDNGATVWVLLSDGKKLGLAAELRFAHGDTIRQYTGYSVIVSKLGIFPLRGGPIGEPVQVLPKGGRVAYKL